MLVPYNQPIALNDALTGALNADAFQFDEGQKTGSEVATMYIEHLGLLVSAEPARLGVEVEQNLMYFRPAPFTVKSDLGITYDLAPVAPEPGTLGLETLAIVGLGWTAREYKAQR